MPINITAVPSLLSVPLSSLPLRACLWHGCSAKPRQWRRSWRAVVQHRHRCPPPINAAPRSRRPPSTVPVGRRLAKHHRDGPSPRAASYHREKRRKKEKKEGRREKKNFMSSST
uniref:Uncharacterized protein n=1 Tax=Oryza sativa subsp. japonica TaxID=39947 RepID=Q9LIX3_ORYSJ|nr:hypothetical protein [Oryza sativa]